MNYDKLVARPKWNQTDPEYLETYKPLRKILSRGGLTCKNCTNCCCGCSKYCCRKFPYVCCFEERVIRKETRTEKLFAIFLFCLAFIICFAQIMELVDPDQKVIINPFRETEIASKEYVGHSACIPLEKGRIGQSPQLGNSTVLREMERSLEESIHNKCLAHHEFFFQKWYINGDSQYFHLGCNSGCHRSEAISSRCTTLNLQS